MAKDYKTRGGRRRSGGGTRPGSRRTSSRGGGTRRGGSAAGAAPGWQWLLAGLATGLLVAAGVYVYDRMPGRGPAAAPAGSAAPLPAPPPAPAAEAAQPAEPPEPRYDFYELLPRYEVVIAEEEAGVAGDEAPAAVEEPGTYVLQAGSFRRHADADRMQATLALQGIESRIQVVTIDSDQAWHRVRIGPVNDLGELDRLRDRLREAGVEFLVIRVGGK